MSDTLLKSCDSVSTKLDLYGEECLGFHTGFGSSWKNLLQKPPRRENYVQRLNDTCNCQWREFWGCRCQSTHFWREMILPVNHTASGALGDWTCTRISAHGFWSRRSCGSSNAVLCWISGTSCFFGHSFLPTNGRSGLVVWAWTVRLSLPTLLSWSTLPATAAQGWTLIAWFLSRVCLAKLLRIVKIWEIMRLKDKNPCSTNRNLRKPRTRSCWKLIHILFTACSNLDVLYFGYLSS